MRVLRNTEFVQRLAPTMFVLYVFVFTTLRRPSAAAKPPTYATSHHFEVRCAYLSTVATCLSRHRTQGFCSPTSTSPTSTRNIAVYVLHHDDESERFARKAFPGVHWARLLSASSSPFFESLAYVTSLKVFLPCSVAFPHVSEHAVAACVGGISGVGISPLRRHAIVPERH